MIVAQKILISSALLLGVLILVVALAVGFAHGETTTSPTLNLPSVASMEPNETLVGLIVGGSKVADQKHEGVFVRVHPKYSGFLFHDEFLLLCGDVTSQLTSGPHAAVLKGYVAITYRRAASHTVQEVPCHNLMGVDKIKETDELN